MQSNHKIEKVPQTGFWAWSTLLMNPDYSLLIIINRTCIVPRNGTRAATVAIFFIRAPPVIPISWAVSFSIKCRASALHPGAVTVVWTIGGLLTIPWGGASLFWAPLIRCWTAFPSLWWWWWCLAPLRAPAVMRAPRSSLQTLSTSLPLRRWSGLTGGKILIYKHISKEYPFASWHFDQFW